jgi:hypothetical protein
VLEKPPAEERAAIDAAIDRCIGVLPQIFAGDMQSAMNKLHTEEKAPAKKVEPAKEPKQGAAAAKPAEKPGLLKSLFGKK